MGLPMPYHDFKFQRSDGYDIIVSHSLARACLKYDLLLRAEPVLFIWMDDKLIVDHQTDLPF